MAGSVSLLVGPRLLIRAGVIPGCGITGNKHVSLYRARSVRGRVSLPCKSPYDVADVVGHQQCPAPVDLDADRPSACVAILVEESGQHVEWLARGLAVGERDEDHLVAAVGLPVP